MLNELKKLPQWVVSGVDKKPYNPYTGGMAQANNPKTWGTYDSATLMLDRKHNDGSPYYKGYGFEFSQNDPYFGIDIDHYVEGEDPQIDKILADFNHTYQEYSRSGKGIHIIGKGKKPGTECRNGTIKNIEIYEQDRYFALTFNSRNGVETVEDCQSQLNDLYNLLFPPKTKVVRTLPTTTSKLEDYEVIEKAKTFNADKFNELYLFGCPEGGDHSACDLALLNILCFWCAGDTAQMDRIFRGSALMRDKWEREDYRRRTFKKVLEDCTSFYNPQEDMDLSYIKYDSAKVAEAFKKQPEFDAKVVQLELSKLKDKERNRIEVILTILASDPQLDGIIVNDIFAQETKINKTPPWSAGDRKGESWSDSDFSGLCLYLEQFGITKEKNIQHAFNLWAASKQYHPIREYLKTLQWDGVPRLDSLFINYLGAEDTPFNRAITRKTFTAAVARVFTPGIKFDQMLVIKGRQGIGKTLILTLMGFDKWHNGNIRDFTGKEPVEQLIGSWIIEIEELSALRRSDELSAKGFLSKQADKVRLAYARNTVTLQRQCVFFGTTNEDTFLKDITGNRRFWIMPCPNVAKIKVWDKDYGIKQIRDQVWAEAKYRYDHNESLVLSEELETVARELQTTHTIQNEYANFINAYLEKFVPNDYEQWSVQRRVEFMANYSESSFTISSKQIDKVTPEMIWLEALGGQAGRFSQRETRLINSHMRSLDNWKQARVSTTYGNRQLGYIRIPKTMDNN